MIEKSEEKVACSIFHFLVIARHMLLKPRDKCDLTTFLETNNLVLLLRRCASAPQRRRRRQATMAAAAHEISLRGIFRRKALPPRARSHPSASVNGEGSRRREMQIFRLSEWARMETAVCTSTKYVSLLQMRKADFSLRCTLMPKKQ